MKKLLIILLLLPLVAAAQSRKDYEKMMGSFVFLYNKNSVDDICILFPAKENKGDDCFWRWAKGGERYDEYGKITSYKYLGIDKTDAGKVRVFKVEFEKKGTKAMSFTLHRTKKFGTFRFDTSSDEIEKMLARGK